MKKLLVLLFILVFSSISYAQGNPIQEFSLKDGYYQLKMYTLDVEFYIDGAKVTATTDMAGYPSTAIYKIPYVSGTRLTAKSTLDGSVIEEIDLTPYRSIEIKLVDLQGGKIRVSLDKIYDRNDLKFYIDGTQVDLLELNPLGCCANAAFLSIIPGTSLRVVWVSTGKEATYSLAGLGLPAFTTTTTMRNTYLAIEDVYLDQGVSDYYVNVKIKNNGNSVNLNDIQYSVTYGGEGGISSRWSNPVTINTYGSTTQKLGVIIAGGASKLMQCNNLISINLLSSSGSVVGSYSGGIRCVPSTTTTTYYRPTTTTFSSLKPDLIVKQIKVLNQDSLFDGASAMIAVDVKNYGGVDIPIGSSWKMDIYLDGVKIDSPKMGYVPKGEDTSTEYPLTLTNLNAGTHTIKAVLDTDNTIKEMDETNNNYEKVIQVKPSQLSAAYFLGDEGKDVYDLYIMPSYPGANPGDILMGAAFTSGSRSLAYSNNPDSRSRTVFALDPFVNSFKIGEVKKSDFSQFTDLEIGMEYNGDKRSIKVPLAGAEIRKIVRCADTDNGINFFEKGTVTAYTPEGSEAKSTDYCKYNGKEASDCRKEGKCSIMEYYCNADGQIGETDSLCPSGCSGGQCTGVVPNLPEMPKEQPGMRLGQACSGCIEDGNCIPYGIRKTMQYCGVDKNIKDQKTNKEQCENNFECASNLCIDGQCVPKGIFRKFSEWFSSMFG